MEGIIIFNGGDVWLLHMRSLDLLDKLKDSQKAYLESILIGIDDGNVICINEEETKKLNLIYESDRNLFKELAYSLKDREESNDINVINKIKEKYEYVRRK